MNANASIFTLRPIVTPRWISTKDAILQPSPTAQPYRLTCSGWWMTTSLPSLTSGAIMRCPLSGPGQHELEFQDHLRIDRGDRDARRLDAEVRHRERGAAGGLDLRPG